MTILRELFLVVRRWNARLMLSVVHPGDDDYVKYSRQLYDMGKS
jgi:hypothetical protein